jgi:splicing factor 3A subunit 1
VFTEIDWRDYAIVHTIEFTACGYKFRTSTANECPGGREYDFGPEEDGGYGHGNTVDDVEAHRACQAAAEAEAAVAVGSAGVDSDEDGAMEQSDDEDEASQERKKREEQEKAREIEQAKALQASSINPAGPMKIRTDYIPKCELPFVFPW